MKKKQYVLLLGPLLLLALNSFSVLAQPIITTKKTFMGFDLYQDFKQENTWYYEPPDIELKLSETGQPEFLLLEMRYTGTILHGDEQEKGFHTILQLTVHQAQIPIVLNDSIKNMIGKKSILKPIPVSKFFGELIIPLGDASLTNEKFRKVVVNGVEQSADIRPGNVQWQERTFTMQLNTSDAQLLWDQIKSGKLGISFSYSYYTDAIIGKTGDIDTTDLIRGLTDQFDSDFTFSDNIQTFLVKANTFSIFIPDKYLTACLRRVDINEELPPAYAGFVVHCYDFTDNLRPDLYKKTIEIRAFGAGKEFITNKMDFTKNNSDSPGRILRFPFAIRLDYPLEYRTTEVNLDGNVMYSPWKSIENWSEIIDITTPFKDNSIGKKSVDFETEISQMEHLGIKEVICELNYNFNNSEVYQALNWTTTDKNNLKSIQCDYDLVFPMRYRLIIISEDGQKKVEPYKLLAANEDYVFLSLTGNK